MKVVDLSDRVAGAFCTRLLAGAGYQAIASGLPVGGWRSVRRDPWLSAYLRDGVITLDDPTELRRHLLDADVVVVWSDQEDTWRVDHRIGDGRQVEVSVGDFDREGPYARYRGSPLVDWASGGHLFITGSPDRPPLPGPYHLPEYITGYAAAFVAELGLAARTGESQGVSVAVSTMELLAGIHQNSFTMLAGTGVVKGRLRHPHAVYPMDIFECADGWACVAVVTDAQYDGLVAVVGESALLLDERFATPMSRWHYSDAFDRVVGEWFRNRMVDDVVAELQQHHVPALRLATPEDVFDDPQMAARNFWIPAPGGGRMPGVPFRTHCEPSAVPPLPPDDGPQRGGLSLDGLVVVDMTEFWSGPSCTRTLADFGATVIRVERPGSRWYPMSAARLQDWKMNRGKLSLAVDLKAPEGPELVRRLIAGADLVVENFRPGVMDRFGLGFADLLPRSTPLVYLSLSGFGQNGPRAEWASFGPLLEAASSIQARTRYPDGPPMLLGHSLPDPVGGLVGAFLALTAVREARHDGASRRVDISQLEAYVACCGEELLRASLSAPEPAGPMLTGVFATLGEDTWVAVEADGSEQIEGLLSVLGLQPTTDLRAAVAGALSTEDRFAVTRRMQAGGVAAFPVMSIGDLADDEGLHRSGFLVQVPFEDATATMPGIPFRGVPHRAGLSAPVTPCGADTCLVLRKYGGLADEEIAALLERGVVSLGAEAVD